MVKKLILFLLFFLLPLIIADYYIQHIASPVEMQERRKERGTKSLGEKEIEMPKREEIKREEKKSLLPAPPEKELLGCNIKTSTINFKDYHANEYSIQFKVCDSLLEQSIENRRAVRAKNPHKKLVDFDAPLIEGIVEEYKKQIRLKKLDYKAGAEYVVSSIQNIPYTMVHTFSHKDAENPATYTREGLDAKGAKRIAKEIKEIHKEKKKFTPLDQIGGCLENVISYGVVSPLEMFLNQMGDCDSRATALFLVLKKLGYDVLELGSDVEGHALLAINLPNPDGSIYYKYRGKKYYVWETTFFHPTQSRVGVHQDGMRYMKNWHLWEVALN